MPSRQMMHFLQVFVFTADASILLLCNSVTLHYFFFNSKCKKKEPGPDPMKKIFHRYAEIQAKVLADSSQLTVLNQCKASIQAWHKASLKTYGNV